MKPGNRYLTVFLLTTLLLFATIWVITIKCRKGFLEPEYSVWQAKFDMIEQCNLGDAVVIGDSRASAAFLPSSFRLGLTNLAISGSGPIEAYFETKKLLSCSKLPRLAILSFSPIQYNRMAWFWTRSARFGLFSEADIAEIRRDERQYSPGLLYQSSYGSEPPGPIKDWLYLNHFPPFEFGNLIGAGVVGRYKDNKRFYRETIQARGEHIEGDEKCAEEPDPAIEQKFSANPLVDHYYSMLLDELYTHGIKVAIVQTPISSLTGPRMSDALESQYMQYLVDHSAGRFAVPAVERLFPVRSNCDFGDDVHLNRDGAVKFSAEVDEELKALLAR